MNHFSRAVYALLLLLAPRPCAACSCEGPPGAPMEELASHDAVLAGRVVEIVEPADFTAQESLLVTFAVSSVWKGDVQQITTVSTAPNGAQCGYPFELGDQYLVYGYSSVDGLHAGLCSLRTNILSAATEDTQQLGDPIATWPVDDSDDCCTVPEILGRWQTASKEEYIEWHMVEFRADGVCVANMILPDDIVVAEFTYARERTLQFEDGNRDKIVFETVRSAYVKQGDKWVPSQMASWREFYFAHGRDGDLTAYPYEQDWNLRGAHYTRTSNPIYTITPDGSVTSISATTWGDLKSAPESNP